MALELFNTLGRKKEPFKPLKGKKVGMYTCGPTIYDFAHIGNFRAYICQDVLRRYLRYKGYAVKQVMNLTDVDDKTIKGAQKEKIPLKEYTDRYRKAFFEDIDALNIEHAEVYPAATEHIPEMVALIQQLLKKKIAYKSDDGSIYYAVSKFRNYGHLALLEKSQLAIGARVKQDEYEKEEARDFALWKAWSREDGDVFWETELGKGRPGWHIECSAMSMKYLGHSFDLHAGGIDLIFPHHTNEIAQSEGATGEPFARYWFHNEHLLVDGKKMSKSLGNFYTLRDLLTKSYSARAIRYVLMATHYRQPLNFTLEGLKAAENTLQRFKDFMLNLKDASGTGGNEKITPLIGKAKTDFEEALDDDLDMPRALGVIFDFIRDVNRQELGRKDAKTVSDAMNDFDRVLGLLGFEEGSLDGEVEKLIQQREEARQNKDFRKADQIRSELKKKGIILEDTEKGTRWKKA
ncbi:cysteine--tRNA ligase [Candidatus Woesearchaeota archaeon]|nr:cysteine--tRNA ligase [Candidatus Woesearchaeota archaeon]